VTYRGADFQDVRYWVVGEGGGFGDVGRQGVDGTGEDGELGLFPDGHELEEGDGGVADLLGERHVGETAVCGFFDE
jgi:hypothetical protein